MLQQHVRRQPSGAAAASASARRHTTLTPAPQVKDAPVTDDMLAAVGDMQMVETVSLLSGGPDNGFTCVRSPPLSFRACPRARPSQRPALHPLALCPRPGAGT